jgi:hypothetical protein
VDDGFANHDPTDTQLIMTPEDYLEAVSSRNIPIGSDGHLWQTCTINDEGNVITLKSFRSIEESFELATEQNVVQWSNEAGILVSDYTNEDIGRRALSPALGVIGGVLLGYVFGTVVDGIVIAVTGESSAYWFAQAVNKVIRRPPPVSLKVYIDCILYVGTDNYAHCRFGITS